MPNFFEFLNERERNTLLKISTSQNKTIAQVSSELQAVSVASSKASNFATRITEVTRSSEFLKPVSDAIGTPKPGESEDEFVARGKAAIVKQLRKTLKLN